LQEVRVSVTTIIIVILVITKQQLECGEPACATESFMVLLGGFLNAVIDRMSVNNP
jgi:hypothetical protein